MTLEMNFSLWELIFKDELLYFWLVLFLGRNGVRNYKELEDYRHRLLYYYYRMSE